MTQTVQDISPLMPMHQDPLLVLLLGQPCVRRSKSYWCISRNSLAPCDSLLVLWSLLMLPSDQLDPRSPFYLLGLTLIPAWINNYHHYIVWNEFTYPFPNFNGFTVEIWGFHPILPWACDYQSMLGLKLKHVSKRGPRNKFRWNLNQGTVIFIHEEKPRTFYMYTVAYSNCLSYSLWPCASISSNES